MENKPTPQPNPKLNLKRDEVLDLRIYFMVARKEDIKVSNEKVVACLAYNLEEALIKAKEEAGPLNIIFHGQSMPVSVLIEKLYLDNIISPQPEGKEIIEPINLEQLSKEQFLAGLSMALEEFAEEKDKEVLREIIKRIKVGKDKKN